MSEPGKRCEGCGSRYCGCYAIGTETERARIMETRKIDWQTRALQAEAERDDAVGSLALSEDAHSEVRHRLVGTAGDGVPFIDDAVGTALNAPRTERDDLADKLSRVIAPIDEGGGADTLLRADCDSVLAEAATARAEIALVRVSHDALLAEVAGLQKESALCPAARGTIEIIDGLRAECTELQKALPGPDKLDLLAAFLDCLDKGNFFGLDMEDAEAQRDLRRWAVLARDKKSDGPTKQS